MEPVHSAPPASSGVVRFLVKLAFLRCRVAFAAWLSRPLCEFRTYISQPARSRELQRCFTGVSLRILRGHLVFAEITKRK